MAFKLPFLRTAYNYDMNKAGDEDAIRCPEPTLTKQSFAEEVDINTIIDRFNISGELPTNVRMPTYQDFETIFDFKTAMDAVAAANESFDAMPATVRARFHNDPQEFVEFCSNANNREEAIKLGLVHAQQLDLAKPTPPAEQPPAAPLAKPQAKKGDNTTDT